MEKSWFLKSGSWSEPKSCVVLRVQRKHSNISGDNSLRDPPVPIPNTEVKPQHAESTWLETAREDRSSPDSIQDTSKDVSFLFLSEPAVYLLY